MRNPEDIKKSFAELQTSNIQAERVLSSAQSELQFCKTINKALKMYETQGKQEEVSKQHETNTPANTCDPYHGWKLGDGMMDFDNDYIAPYPSCDSDAFLKLRRNGRFK